MAYARALSIPDLTDYTSQRQQQQNGANKAKIMTQGDRSTNGEGETEGSCRRSLVCLNPENPVSG